MTQITEAGALDCGHPPTATEGCGTGVAIALDDRTMCYACAEAAERAAFAKARVFSGYVKENTFTTWTGAPLAYITRITTDARRYMPNGGSVRMRHVWATDFDNGSHWYGRGSDEWDLVTLRRVRS